MGKENNEARYGTSVNIDLCLDDHKALLYKCGKNGLTIESLVNSFLNDLVGGRYRNGSDECDLADAWFERCGFDIMSEPSLLGWLLEQDTICSFVHAHNELQLAYRNYGMVASIEQPDEETVDDCLYEIRQWEGEYQEYFDDFIKEYPHFFDNEDFELKKHKEIIKVLDWYDENEEIINP